MEWLKTHFWLISSIAGVIAFCFTTFASVRYVDEQVGNLEHRVDRVSTFIKETQNNTDHKLERMEDKIDLLIHRLIKKSYESR